MLLLKERNFLYIWLGQLASIFGNRFSEFAIPLIVLKLTGSPWQAGLVAVCSQVAPLLLAIPAGAWVEGKSKRQVAILSEGVRVIAMLGLVFAVIFKVVSVWVLAGTLLIMGAAGVFFRIAFHAMVPSIVGRGRLVQAHNYFEGADAISTLTGPALAGIVFTVFGMAMTLAVDAISFFISLVGLLLIRFEERSVAEVAGPSKSSFKGVKDGLRYLVGNRVQRFVTVNHVLLNFTTTAVVLTVIVFAKQNLELNPVEIGLLLSAAGVGNVVGVFLLSRMSQLPWGYLFGGIMLVSGMGVGLLMMSETVIVAAIGMFLFDGALSMGFVVNGSARQAITPDHFLARVSSGGILLSGVAAIVGSLFAGGISEFVSPQAALVGCGGLLVVSGFISIRLKEIGMPLDQVEPVELEK
ncbi:MFS transporter [Cytobacillus suaedae]|nr:MFS transporter [Cytobacillus suaedae]